MATNPNKAGARPAPRPTPARVPPRRPAPRAGAVRPQQRVLVVDQKNMLLLWLEEKIIRREITPAEADKIKDSGISFVKDGVGVIKDAAGSAKLLHKIAKDFGTWKGAKVRFTTGARGVQLVTFYGWPNNRAIIRGTRYRVTHPKMIEMQIGRPGIKAGAVESARFGIYLVVAADVYKYITTDKATLGSLLGDLSYDIPAVMFASAVGAACGSLVSGTAVGTMLIGSFTLGPIAVAFIAGVVIGLALNELNNRYGISEKLGKLWDRALARLAEVWDDLSDEAEARYNQLLRSRFVHDLDQNITWLSRNIGRQADIVGGKIASFW